MSAPALAEPEPSAHRAATAAVLAHVTIGVVTSFVSRSTLAHVPALALTMMRAGGAAPLLAGLWLSRPAHRRPAGADLAKTVALGFVGVTLNQTLYFLGMAESTPSRSSLIYALTPLFVLVIGRLRGTDRIDRHRLAGLLLAFSGVALVVSERGGLDGATPRGDVFILLGALAWALYTVLARPLLDRYDSGAVTAAALLGGALAYAPIGVPAIWAAPLADVPASTWAGVLWLCVVTSFVSYNLWFLAVRALPPSRVAVFMNLQPPMTILASWGLFGERVGPRFVAGAALSLAGVWTAQGGLRTLRAALRPAPAGSR